jgi:hypothetical protein
MSFMTALWSEAFVIARGLYDRYVVLFFCRSRILPLAGVVWSMSMLCSAAIMDLSDGTG